MNATSLRAMLGAIALSSVVVGPVLAQGAPPVDAARISPAASFAWSDAELGAIGDMLKGTWKTTAPVSEAGTAAGQSSEIFMAVSPVRLSALPDAMYVEQARANALHAPYRNAIFQLYKNKGKIRLRTYEFTGNNFDSTALVGLWMAPDLFPDVPRANLIATLDLEISKGTDGKSYTGSTPYAYPTGAAGAVEMTSSITVTPTSFESADRGMDAAGKVVWGAGANDKVKFSRFEPYVKPDRREGGLVFIEYFVPKEDVMTSQLGDKVIMNYSAWVLDSCYRFDSTYPKAAAQTFVSTPTTITGLREATVGLRKGSIRRVYMTPERAYGAERRGPVPANSTIMFAMEVIDVQPGKPPEIAPGVPYPKVAPAHPSPQATPEQPKSPEPKGTPETPR